MKDVLDASVAAASLRPNEPLHGAAVAFLSPLLRGHDAIGKYAGGVRLSSSLVGAFGLLVACSGAGSSVSPVVADEGGGGDSGAIHPDAVDGGSRALDAAIDAGADTDASRDAGPPPYLSHKAWTVRRAPIWGGQYGIAGDPSIRRDGKGLTMAYTCFDPNRQGTEICIARSLLPQRLGLQAPVHRRSLCR